MSFDPTSSRQNHVRPMLAACALVLTSLISGCAGYSGSTSTTPSNPTAAQSTTQVKIGDAPATPVLSFEVTIGPIDLTSSSGTTVHVLTGTRRIELAHLSATSEVLSLLKIPQDTYASATFTVSHPEVTFVDHAGAVHKLEPSLSQSITLNFSPALNISATSSVLNIDLNVANSVALDAQGNVTGVTLSSSSFNFTSSAVAAEDHQQHDDGELEDTRGTITAVNGTSFTLTLDAGGAVLTFATDSNTRFNDNASLTAGSIVTVEGITRADGTLYAKEIEGVESEHGSEAEGIITSVTGNPASSLAFVADNGMGSGVDDTTVGSTITADLSRADFRVSNSNIDTSGIGGLPSGSDFPFDATTIHAGQRIEIDNDGALTGTSLAARHVALQQQALVGTVSGLSGATSSGPASFTLTLDPNSAFALLSGQTQIHVTWQQGTNLHHLTSVNNSDTVRVRGLVFFGAGGVNMIAARIDQP